MMELILTHPHVFWLTLGGLLLAAEMLGGNGYLLWSGVAAVIVGLVVWLLPLGWEWQGLMFALLTLLAAWLWWCANKSPPTVSLTSAGNSLLAAASRWITH